MFQFGDQAAGSLALNRGRIAHRLPLFERLLAQGRNLLEYGGDLTSAPHGRRF